jgi:hypothetical protein
MRTISIKVIEADPRCFLSERPRQCVSEPAFSRAAAAHDRDQHGSVRTVVLFCPRLFRFYSSPHTSHFRASGRDMHTENHLRREYGKIRLFKAQEFLSM